MEYKMCNIKGFENLYRIYENGDIYSERKRKFLKGAMHGTHYNYRQVFLNNETCKWIGVHILVAHHFINPKPKGCEVDHIDGNPLNNHYSNLEWITHQENMLRARQMKHWRSDRLPGFTASKSTKQKMAEKKFKKVLFFNNTQDIIYNSIQDALNTHAIQRRKFNRYVNTNKPLNGFKMKIL